MVIPKSKTLHHLQGWLERYGDQECQQFRGAELICQKWGFTREQLEVFALESHERAARAQDEGRFDNEILPYGEVLPTKVCAGARRSRKMAQLPTLEEGGVITAAVASQISDGAAAILVAGEQAVKDHDLTPRARIHHISVRGDDPIYMLTGPIAATEYALEKTGMSIDDFDLFECNEAFAPVPLGLDARTQRPSRQGERERRRHRSRPSSGLHRRSAHDHDAQRARAHRRAIRPPDNV